MKEFEEHQLITLAQQGDEAAFTALFQRHYSFIYNYLIKMTFNPMIAEELLQETMLKGYLQITSFNHQSKFTSWLITIATRTYIDLLRKKKRERGLFKRAADEHSSSLKWELQLKKVDFNEVMEAISTLKPLYRIPLLLRHYYGFTYVEIGEILNCQEGTAKSRVNKSIKLVRKEMQEDEGR